jgi:release factor glutamine methyltransferase
MTIREAITYSVSQLRSIYEEGEAVAISNLVMDHILDGKMEKVLVREKELSEAQHEQLNGILQRLLTHEPVQYVLSEAWFCGLKFYVDKNVLVPRPETEELVEWIISNCKFPVDALSILDIGSGSGCIPIALKRRIRKAEVWSCDTSEPALQVARRNASVLGTDVNFLHLDFLDSDKRETLPSFDIIVSNPPYVPEKDKTQMNANVVRYEPSIALFVPDNDALVFYKAIATFGKSRLNPEGAIYMEIHEDLGDAVMELFREKGYVVELKKDMQGKDRMVRATRY